MKTSSKLTNFNKDKAVTEARKRENIASGDMAAFRPKRRLSEKIYPEFTW